MEDNKDAADRELLINILADALPEAKKEDLRMAFNYGAAYASGKAMERMERIKRLSTAFFSRAVKRAEKRGEL